MHSPCHPILSAFAPPVLSITHITYLVTKWDTSNSGQSYTCLQKGSDHSCRGKDKFALFLDYRMIAADQLSTLRVGAFFTMVSTFDLCGQAGAR